MKKYLILVAIIVAVVVAVILADYDKAQLGDDLKLFYYGPWSIEILKFVERTL